MSSTLHNLILELRAIIDSMYSPHAPRDVQVVQTVPSSDSRYSISLSPPRFRGMQRLDKQLSRSALARVFDCVLSVDGLACHSGEVFVIFATSFTASLHRDQIPLDGVGLREFEFLRDVSAKGVRLDNKTAGVTREPSAVSAYELVRELEERQESYGWPLQATKTLQG